MKKLFTSESVTEGHPDKICDQVSDAILDAIIAKDKNAHVAVETIATTGLIFVAGEITTDCYVDIPGVVRATLKDIGYTNPEFGLDSADCAVLTAIHEQSKNIALGVNSNKNHEQGAGDQGSMYGYACLETPDYMPLPITLAHQLTRRLAQVRKEKILPWVRPDGKSQVTIEYEADPRTGNSTPRRIEAIVIAVHHNPEVSPQKIREEIIKNVIEPVCSAYVAGPDFSSKSRRQSRFGKKLVRPDGSPIFTQTPIDKNTKIFINSTGIFIIGGPEADTGLTGRKIIVDTYGGSVPHGGGAFSGKDPSKVDRSGAYAARYIAKNIVAAGLAERCLVQLAYTIGVADPVSIAVDCFGTTTLPENRLIGLIKKEFPLKPADIIRQLKLLRPIYRKTAAYGHFGRSEPEFSWEKIDKAAKLRTLIK